MKILCLAYVTNRENVDKQVLKQTRQPDRTIVIVDDSPAKGIEARRKRIAENQHKLQAVAKAYGYDLVWQIEEDGDLPEDCLQRLVANYNKLKNKGDFGYVSGIEIGRHGLYHIGAWVNITDTHFESVNHTLKGIQKVEATGLYCLLAPTQVFISGKASWTDEPYGPDVVWGRSLKKDIYVDMGLHIGHITPKGTIRPDHISTTTVYFDKNNNKWRYKIV